MRLNRKLDTSFTTTPPRSYTSDPTTSLSHTPTTHNVLVRRHRRCRQASYQRACQLPQRTKPMSRLPRTRLRRRPHALDRGPQGRRGHAVRGRPVENRREDPNELPKRATNHEIPNAHLPSERPPQGQAPSIIIIPLIHERLLTSLGAQTGEICLDVFKEAWTPVYTISQTLTTVHQLLTSPEPGSPLNVDAAAVLRNGDVVGYESLVRLWSVLYAGKPSTFTRE